MTAVATVAWVKVYSPVMRRRTRLLNENHLHNTLAAMLRLSAKSPDLWPSISAIAGEAGASRRAVQHHLRELQRRDILTQKYPANSTNPKFGEDYEHDGAVVPIRRPATYRLNLPAFREFTRQAPPGMRLLYPPQFIQLAS